MTGQLRWGILGTGGIASAFVRDLQEVGEQVVAVGSRTQEAADAFGEKFGIARRHPTYASLAEDPEVDAIYVSTPHPMHAENAILVLRAGKHVLVEKPFTMNRTEAEQVMAVAAEQNLIAQEAMWTRFLPHMLRIHEIIDAGTIGVLQSVLADHTQSLPTDPKHRLNDPGLGGGALLDLGIYPISFAVDILGLPCAVQATAQFTATGVDRRTSILLEHDGGAGSVLLTASDAKGPNRATVIGSLGRIDVDDTWYAPTTFTVFDQGGRVIETHDGSTPARGMQYEALEVARLVAAGETESDRLPRSETVAIMGVLDDIRAQIGLRYPGE